MKDSNAHSISASIHSFTGQVLLLFWKMRDSSFSNILELFCYLKVRWSDTEVDIPRLQHKSGSAGVHWAPAERRGRPIKCHGDSIQQRVLWDVSASFSVSQVMKRVPGDVTRQLAAVTAPLCLSAPVWPLRWELQPHTHIYTHAHTHTLYATSSQSLEKIHLWKSNVSN